MKFYKGRVGALMRVVFAGLFLSVSVPLWADKSEGVKLEGDKSVAVSVKPKKRWGRSFFRSALIPGWGQWKNGDGWLGLGVLSVFALNAAWFSMAGPAESKSYQEYLRAKTSSDAETAWNNNRLQAQFYRLSQYSLATVYVLQLGEAAYDAPMDPPAKSLAEMRPVLFAFDWEF
jgi:hypothetical protein